MTDYEAKYLLEEWVSIVTNNWKEADYVSKLIRANGWDNGVKRTHSQWQHAADFSGIHPRWSGYVKRNGK